MNSDNHIAVPKRNSTKHFSSGVDLAKPEREATYEATAMIVVGIGATGGRVVSQFQQAVSGMTSGLRPIGAAVIGDKNVTARENWNSIETAMTSSLEKLGVNPQRRIGMCWDVLLVAGDELKAEQIQILLQDWRKFSRWPLRVTLLVDASSICLPWVSPRESCNSQSWEEMSEHLSELDKMEQDDEVFWNGCYLTGIGNRFGYALDEEFRNMHIVRLLTVFATSDLQNWIGSLPTCTGDGLWPAKEHSFGQFSAIGVSSLWHPHLPWAEQVLGIRIRQLSEAYENSQRLGNPYDFAQWSAFHLDCFDQIRQLENRLLARIYDYTQSTHKDISGQWRELLTKVGDRGTRCIAPIGKELERYGQKLFENLDRRIDGVGQELVLHGGNSAFEQTLEGVEGRLTMLAKDARRDQGEIHEKLRVESRLLTELLYSKKNKMEEIQLPAFLFFVCWLRNWRRQRHLQRTRLTLRRILGLELRESIGEMLYEVAKRSLERLRWYRQQLYDFQTRLQSVGTKVLDRTRRSFETPAPTDRPRIAFEAVQTWVDKILGPVPHSLPESLGNVHVSESQERVAPWHSWDCERIETALRVLAEQEIARHRSILQDNKFVAEEACQLPPNFDEITYLSRLSHPLIPIQSWAFDANPQCVFQRWFIPQEQCNHWQELSLPNEEVPIAANVPWPTVVTVYREVPFTSFGCSFTKDDRSKS